MKNVIPVWSGIITTIMYTEFGPAKTSSLEVKWWQAHNNKDHTRLVGTLIFWLQELYGTKRFSQIVIK
ncbi:hypothetical protein A3F64_01450 [Candidatus Saccharibacteria bacterium RIFCSPHIGHO2_12_FULL_42_8]|nr:MAG: hypothetical protein A3F64_01450 [Candidatus Saccharibacteria bacterium RIFCSPHIGHO2_12_FULL_42_8]